MARLHPADIRAIAVAVADEIERRQAGDGAGDDVEELAAQMIARVRAVRAAMVRSDPVPPPLPPTAPSEWIPDRELARMVGVSPVTLYSWRARAEGPPFVKVGRLVRYRRADVEAWLASRSRGGVSADPVPGQKPRRKR